MKDTRGFLISSVAANALLALSAYVLYTTNTDLTVTASAQKATITGLGKTTEVYRQQVAECVTQQKRLIIEHREDIDSYQKASLRALELNKGRIDQLLQDRGVIERALYRIKMPEQKQEASERIAAIDRAIDSYIADLRR